MATGPALANGGPAPTVHPTQPLLPFLSLPAPPILFLPPLNPLYLPSPPQSGPLKPARESGECCNPHQAGSGRNPARSRILLHCMLTKRICLQHFWFFGRHCNEWQNESQFRLRSDMESPCNLQSGGPWNRRPCSVEYLERAYKAGPGGLYVSISRQYLSTHVCSISWY